MFSLWGFWSAPTRSVIVKHWTTVTEIEIITSNEINCVVYKKNILQSEIWCDKRIIHHNMQLSEEASEPLQFFRNWCDHRKLMTYSYLSWSETLLIIVYSTPKKSKSVHKECNSHRAESSILSNFALEVKKEKRRLSVIFKRILNSPLFVKMRWSNMHNAWYISKEHLRQEKNEERRKEKEVSEERSEVRTLQHFSSPAVLPSTVYNPR